MNSKLPAKKQHGGGVGPLAMEDESGAGGGALGRALLGGGGGWPRVRRVRACDLSLAAFERDFLRPNDCVAVVEGAVAPPPGAPGADEWAAAGLWRDPSSGGVAIGALMAHFATSPVCATECPAPGDPEPVGGRRCRILPFSEYAAYWSRHVEARRHGTPLAEPLLYVQNWHLPSELPPRDGPPFYRVPRWFRSDWLNSFLDSEREQERGQEMPGAGAGAGGGGGGGGVGEAGCGGASDYRFVYLGPAGTSTPLHVDVLHSYSWSVNVVGRKLWRLVPPEWTECLMGPGGELAPALESALPGFTRVGEALPHVVEVIQGVGEAIFVPSGWHHTVLNLEDTLSVNHNWLNSFNCQRAWTVLRADFREACSQIEDCRDLCEPGEFLALAQRNLRLNSGIQLTMFGRLLAQAGREARAAVDDGNDSAAHDLSVVRRLLGEVLQELTSACPTGARVSAEVSNLVASLPALSA